MQMNILASAGAFKNWLAEVSNSSHSIGCSVTMEEDLPWLPQHQPIPDHSWPSTCM